MKFAHSIRETFSERAPILALAMPRRGNRVAFGPNVVELLPKLDPRAAHPAPLGSFPQQSVSSLHDLRVAPSKFWIRKMLTAKDVLSRTQARLSALIDHERQKNGSAAIAIKVVARRIGASASWVRKITGGYGEATVQAHKFLNIIREHVRVTGAKRKAAKHARIFRTENPSQAELSA